MKKIILSLFAITTIISCNKDSEIISNDKNHSHDNSTHLASSHSISPSAIIDDKEKTDPIVTNGYSVDINRNVLIFSTENSFENLMNSIVNQEEYKIDSWENSINFQSLRTYHENYMNNNDIDEIEYEDNRIEDIYFESVLNSNFEIEIENKRYTFNFPNNSVKVLSLEDNSEIVINLSSSNNSFLCEDDYKTNTPTIEYPSQNRKLKGKKWVKNWLIYASTGAKTISYKGNKRKKADKHSIYIDQWNKNHSLLNTCSLNGPGGLLSEKIVEDKLKTRTNKKKMTLICRYRTLDVLKVIEYGRVHSWLFNDYNNDSHNEAW